MRPGVVPGRRGSARRCGARCRRWAAHDQASQGWHGARLGRGTNGVDTDGAAAEVRKFVRSGKKVRPGTFVRIKAGQQEYPKGPSAKKRGNGSDHTNADPIGPSPMANRLGCRGGDEAPGYALQGGEVGGGCSGWG